MRYEKGRKDASRRRIVEGRGECFRGDWHRPTGLASIMGEAGLTNGAFYPHFQSKAELVGESVAAALGDQTKQLQEILASGGLDLAISSYLSAEHRDNPAEGCTLAALLPELARQPSETRSLFADRLLDVSRQVSAALPPDTRDRETLAIVLQATLIGTLQLARAVQGTALSDRILAAGADAARALVRSSKDQNER